MSKRTWRKTRHLIVKDGAWRPEYSLLLERYVRSCEVARHARHRLAVRAAADPASAYTTTGSQGQLVQHPDLKTAREAERDAHEYAGALLLTRAARQRLAEPQAPSGKFAQAFK